MYETMKAQVDANPSEFNNWVKLLDAAVAENLATEIVRECYQKFLDEFPLCYGYWNKWANFEMKLGLVEKIGQAPKMDPSKADKAARDVFERGVGAVRYSVDIWMNYCDYLTNVVHANAREACAIIERAVDACGSNPGAGPLWERYIALETRNNDMVKLNAVFMRIFQMPLRDLGVFWEKYNHFVLAQQLSTLATKEELDHLAKLHGTEDEGVLRIKVFDKVEQVKMASQQYYERRYPFESLIDRAYFHVTPLSESSLANWKAYLDFEEHVGNEEAVEALYERCVIVCANYGEIWTRYAYWMDEARGTLAACKIFKRATNTFLKRKPNVHLDYACYLEAIDRQQQAKKVYDNILLHIAPNLPLAWVKYAIFKKRRHDECDVNQVYQDALKTNMDSDAKGKMYMYYANFLYKCEKNQTKAREMCELATKVASMSKSLWTQFIEFEASILSDDVVIRVQKVYQNAIAESSKLSVADKELFWSQYILFMETNANNAKEIKNALHDQRAWRKANVQTKKRALENGAVYQTAKVSKPTSYYNYTANYSQPTPAPAYSYPSAGYNQAAAYHSYY